MRKTNMARAIKVLRIMQSMTQQELAAKAHTSHPYISVLENGSSEPGIELIERLATAFEMRPYELVRFAESVTDVSKLTKELENGY